MFEELKPCPFCNGEAELCGRETREFFDGEWSKKPKQGWYILCKHRITCIMAQSIGFQSATFVTPEAAVKGWNRRNGEDGEE